MGTLAETFLGDLDELGESSEEEERLPPDDKSNDQKRPSSDVEDDEVMENADDIRAEPEDNDLDAVLQNLGGKGVQAVTALRRSPKFIEHMKKIHEYTAKPAARISGGALQDHPEYKLIVASNQLLTKIDDEIDAAYKFVVDKYSKKFPELESLVPNRLDYVRVVKRIGNELDMTSVELNDILPSTAVMTVSMSSSTSGATLPEEDLKEALEGCDETLALELARKEILAFIESRMASIAPNVSAIVGTAIAAQLIGLAGGLINLSRMPSCNIQILGQQRKNLGGFSSTATLPHTGVIYFSDLVQDTPPYLRTKACRVVAGKITLAARVDSHQQDNKGTAGIEYRRQIDDKIEKWQEPEKAKTKKALPRPDEKPRRKRGGKRYRKMKERMQSEVREQLNRQTFGSIQEEYGDHAMGREFGMLGKEGSGKMRVMKKEQRQNTKKLRTLNAGSSGATSGLASSLAFTPVQGIELINPEAAQEKIRQINKRYFGDGGFSRVSKPS